MLNNSFENERIFERSVGIHIHIAGAMPKIKTVDARMKIRIPGSPLTKCEKFKHLSIFSDVYKGQFEIELTIW